MAVDTAELEARQREQEERRKRADLTVDWLEGRLPSTDRQSDPSPALKAMQRSADRFAQRYSGGDRAADAARHEERLEERNKRAAESFARRTPQPGQKQVMRTVGGHSYLDYE